MPPHNLFHNVRTMKIQNEGLGWSCRCRSEIIIITYNIWEHRGTINENVLQCQAIAPTWSPTWQPTWHLRGTSWKGGLQFKLIHFPHIIWQLSYPHIAIDLSWSSQTWTSDSTHKRSTRNGSQLSHIPINKCSTMLENTLRMVDCTSTINLSSDGLGLEKWHTQIQNKISAIIGSIWGPLCHTCQKTWLQPPRAVFHILETTF